jgi:hypothetical protein
MTPLIITNDSLTARVFHLISILILSGCALGLIFSFFNNSLTPDRKTFYLVLGISAVAFYTIANLANKDKSTVKLEATSITISTSKETKKLAYTDIKEIRPTVESFRQTKNLPGPLTLNVNFSTTVYLYLKTGEEIPLGIIRVADIQKMNDYIKASSGKDFMSQYL